MSSSALLFPTIFAPYASAKTTDRFKFGGFITHELGGGVTAEIGLFNTGFQHL